MECPHCHEEIPGTECPQCETIVPVGSRFCMQCGNVLVDGAKDDTENESDFDLEDRILCSDGTCTGIIIDGKCSECGKPPEESD